MDIIYSRNNIRFKKIDKKKKLKLKILALVFIIFSIIYMYIKSSYPIFISSCRNKANSMAVNIVSDEVRNVMKDYTYEDLVDVNIDDNGKVRFIQIKSDMVNNLISQISNNIQYAIDESETAIIYINLGKVTGIRFLSYFGPKFKIELERSGNIQTRLNSEFKTVGINQTIHKINLDIDCEISVLTPFENVAESTKQTVVLTESVIVGEIPQNYHFYDNFDSESAINFER